ncbi:MAG: polysaccharide deacetylase family protein [Planctomycetota bacterium]|nr:polysaccharide deacetylase family protein [Planctomycetota bacterium]
MKRLAETLLCALGWPRRYRERNRRKLLVLMYHGVSRTPLRPFCWHQLPVDAFRRQLAWVREHYNVIPLSEAVAQLEAGALPDRAAAITFDDGFKNNLDVALPVLESLGLPATIYLPTSVIGTDTALWPDRLYLAIAKTSVYTLDATALDLGTLPIRTTAEKEAAIQACWHALKTRAPEDVDAFLDAAEAELGKPDRLGEFALLDWDEVKTLAASPLIELAAHTETHPILAQCDDARVVREIHGSHEVLRKDLGIEPTTFAYPNGRLVDFDERARRAVTAEGVDFALSTENGLVDAESDRLALPRMCIGSDLTFSRFRLLVTGALAGLRG